MASMRSQTRSRRRRYVSRMAVMSQPSATTAASWRNAGTLETRYWWAFCISAMREEAAASHPSRQPVMAQGLEKESTTTVRSRSSGWRTAKRSYPPS